MRVFGIKPENAFSNFMHFLELTITAERRLRCCCVDTSCDGEQFWDFQIFPNHSQVWTYSPFPSELPKLGWRCGHEDMAREGHIHPIIKRWGERIWAKILWCFNHAGHRLSCLQEEKDVLWCHSHQKNESSVSAATWGESHRSQGFGGGLRVASKAGAQHTVLLSGWQRYRLGSWCKGREHLENPQPNLVLTGSSDMVPLLSESLTVWTDLWSLLAITQCKDVPSAISST